MMMGRRISNLSEGVAERGSTEELCNGGGSSGKGRETGGGDGGRGEGSGSSSGGGSDRSRMGEYFKEKLKANPANPLFTLPMSTGNACTSQGVLGDSSRLFYSKRMYLHQTMGMLSKTTIWTDKQHHQQDIRRPAVVRSPCSPPPPLLCLQPSSWYFEEVERSAIHLALTAFLLARESFFRKRQKKCEYAF
ncbi:hypothetical protein EJ110_NYTH49995 [Nymphaea thermarum]|nr:hypothetical protein EJ110_NYTH49995 [Nymphaea thermarum]